MNPQEAYLEGFCAAGYPYTPQQPTEDVREAYEAGMRAGACGDQERADLAYLGELGREQNIHATDGVYGKELDR